MNLKNCRCILPIFHKTWLKFSLANALRNYSLHEKNILNRDDDIILFEFNSKNETKNKLS